MTPSSPTPALMKSILVVDDQKTLAELWRIKLGQMGFAVEVGSDGVQALDLMKKQKFDVILLDLFMPKKSGFEVLAEKAETLNGDTPTYVITSSIKREDIEKAKTLGAKKMFLKYEVSPRDVVNSIKEEIGLV